MKQSIGGNKEITLDDLALMIGKGFNKTNGKIAKIDARVDELVGAVNGLDGRMDKLENRMDKLETKVDDGFLRVNARLDTIEMRIVSPDLRPLNFFITDAICL